MKFKNENIQAYWVANYNDFEKFNFARRSLPLEKFNELKLYKYKNLDGEWTAYDIFKIKYFDLFNAKLIARLTGTSYNRLHLMNVTDKASFGGMLSFQNLIENYNQLEYIEELSRYLRGK